MGRKVYKGSNSAIAFTKYSQAPSLFNSLWSFPSLSRQARVRPRPIRAYTCT